MSRARPVIQVFRGKTRYRPKEGVWDRPGVFYVRKRAENGKILWHSQGYKTKRGAMKMARRERFETMYSAAGKVEVRVSLEDLT